MNITSPRALSRPTFLAPLAGIEPTTSTRCGRTLAGHQPPRQIDRLDGRIDHDLEILLLRDDLRLRRPTFMTGSTPNTTTAAMPPTSTVSSRPANDGNGTQSGRLGKPQERVPGGRDRCRSELHRAAGPQPLLARQRAPATVASDDDRLGGQLMRQARQDAEFERRPEDR